MDFNKITADLDFIASIVHIIDIKANKSKITNETKRGFGLDIKCNSPKVENGIKYGNLLMQVDVTLQDGDENPDTFKIILEGMFSANENIPDDKFMELLNINGGAALLSIARSKIEVLSSMTYFEGKVVLPMVNIVQYFQERNKAQP